MSLFNRDTLRSPQLKKKHRKVAVFRLTLLGAVCVVALISISLASKLDAVEIQTVETKGNTLVTQEEIQEVVDRVTEGNYAKLFSKRNIFIYPEERIRAELLASYPILSSAEVEFNGLKTIVITVSERSPSSLVCVLVEGAQPFTDQCYFMDSTGFIYSKAPEFKGSAYFKYYGLIEGDPIGQSFLNPSDYAELLRFFEGMKLLGVTPLYIHVRQDRDVESYLRGGGRIMISLRDDLTTTIVNLEAILKENIGGEHPDASIEYIDLRYGNKIFYKLRQ